MLKVRIIAAVVALMTFVCSAAAQEKYSKVIIYPASAEQRVHLVGLLEIDHFMESGGGITTEISSQGVALLKSSGVTFKVLVDDVAESLRK